MTKKRKNLIIAAAMIAILAIAGISAYFTATDSVKNTFTVGKIDIDQQEPSFDPDDTDHQNVVPNQEIAKDPQVKNTGSNPAYVFTAVCVPKKSVKVGNTTTGESTGTSATNPAVDANPVLTQLFQLNATNGGSDLKMTADNMLAAIGGKTDTGTTGTVGATFTADKSALPLVNKTANANVWNGVDTWNSGWYMIDVNAMQSTSLGSGDNSVFKVNGHNLLDYYNVYLFAYGTKDSMTALAANGTTPAVFNSVTIANVVDIEDALYTASSSSENSMDYDSKLVGTMPEILVKSFAIQSANIKNNGATSSNVPETNPVNVWNVLNNQDGAYRALADELFDLSKDWETAAEDHTNRNVGNN